jgi:hypothetical protein
VKSEEVEGNGIAVIVSDIDGSFLIAKGFSVGEE